ncbi:MAG: hypothetical protein SFU27_12480 [Thermonemataceae bacterium]|nr:hypothetical protein [Thermonemataceae bacterium]
MTLETLLRIIPENRRTWTLGVDSKFDSQFDMSQCIGFLNKISEQKFEMRFIQSEYHSAFEVSDIAFQGEICQLSQIVSDRLDIEEMLLQINEWCPEGYFFDFMKIESLTAVVFVDEQLEATIKTEGYGNDFYFLHKRKSKEQ